MGSVGPPPELEGAGRVGVAGIPIPVEDGDEVATGIGTETVVAIIGATVVFGMMGGLMEFGPDGTDVVDDDERLPAAVAPNAGPTPGGRTGD
jgi:hypothetical protein